MKIILHLINTLALCALLSGCELLCQAGTGTCGMSKEQAHKLLHPKPYIERWIKEGMSRESRSQDSISCGGSDRGTDFSNQQLNAARQLEDKNDFAPRTRLSMAWVECMKSKGYEYRYTGTY